jgi:zinc protease
VKPHHSFVTTVVALLLSSPAVAAPAPKVETFTLSNGLQVAFMRLDAAPVVAVQVWYHVGSKDEPRDRRGSAHMFEHIMFKGSTRVRAEDHSRFLNSVGGVVNAETQEDSTHYINLVPASYLDFTLQLESERMRNLLFRDDVIATERDVVKEEIRQQLNVPVTRGFWRFLASAYTKHPYAWTAAGKIDDLDATKPSELKKFYDTYYQPNNALIVVVGNSTLEQVKDAVTKQFGSIPAGPTPPRPSQASVEPEQTSMRREIAESSQLGLVIAGYKIPPAKHLDVYALQLASLIMGNGESSRLRARIKKIDATLKHAVGIDGGVQAQLREETGLWMMLGAYLNAADVDALEAAMFDEVARLVSSPPTANELRQAKNQIQASVVFSLENVTGMAEQIGHSWILTGDATAFMRDVNELEKVTAADIVRVTKQYLTNERATVLVMPPKGAVIQAAPAGGK